MDLRTESNTSMPSLLLPTLKVPKMLCERGGVSTICSDRKRKFCDRGDLHLAKPFEEKFGSSSDSGQGVCRQLREEVASKWAKSVVSLTSFNEGGSIHFACTGMVIDHTEIRANLLTSLSLFRSCDDDSKITREMTTKVRLPNNQVVNGVLLFHDLKYNVAVVSVWLRGGGGVRAACLDHQQQLEYHSQVVAVSRCYSSGNLMATTGMLVGDPLGIYPEDFAFSSCEFTMAAAGGPLIDSHGSFVGLICYAEEGAAFIPRSTIHEIVAGFQGTYGERRARVRKARADLEVKMRRRRMDMPAWSPPNMSCLEASSRMEKKHSVCHYCDPEGRSAPGGPLKGLFLLHLSIIGDTPRWPADGDSVSKEARRNKIRSNGYPFPVLDDFGMRLLCNFEEEFGEDIWSKLTKEVASDMSQSVVALASFSGDTRFFACTGIFIDCNESTTRVLTSASLVRSSDDEAKVADNLKIEVCLPDKQYATGTLQHCNLHYNIAVISIMGSPCTRTAQIFDQVQTEPHGEVVAVGRVYESGKLIATGGTLIDKPSKLDCKELMMSTCKITKAGIGGPLIDFDGNFIGMNFYSSEETPYLPRNIILEVFRNFDARPDAIDFINDHNSNRWPVPKPYWCYPLWDQYMGEEIDHRPQPM